MKISKFFSLFFLKNSYVFRNVLLDKNASLGPKNPMYVLEKIQSDIIKEHFISKECIPKRYDQVTIICHCYLYLPITMVIVKLWSKQEFWLKSNQISFAFLIKLTKNHVRPMASLAKQLIVSVYPWGISGKKSTSTLVSTRTEKTNVITLTPIPNNHHKNKKEIQNHLLHAHWQKPGTQTRHDRRFHPCDRALTEDYA